jgi:Ty3 transposon capsid-like protein
MGTQNINADMMNDITVESVTMMQHEIGHLRSQITELTEHVRLAGQHRTPPQNTGGTSGQDMSGSGAQNQVWKIPKPNHYLGVRDSLKLGLWLTRMKTYLRMTETPLQHRVEVAAAYLGSSAYVWYTTVSSAWEFPDVGYVPWEHFEQQLRDNFLPTNAEQKYWNQWHELHQDHSVDFYVSRFRQLLTMKFNDNSISPAVTYQSFEIRKTIRKLEVRKQIR